MVNSYNCGLWFGTMNRMEWLPTPLQGAEMNLDGWSEGGSLLNGGGFQMGSFDSHQNYGFEWRGSSSYEAAQKIRSYAQGSFGRGLIYFHLPTTYDKNVLPARWADPSLTLDNEGTSLVPGVEPQHQPLFTAPGATGVMDNKPAGMVSWDMTGVAPLSAQNVRERGVFVPIPHGFSLMLGATYDPSSAGSEYGGIAVVPAANDGGPVMNDLTYLTPLPLNDGKEVNLTVGGYKGVYLVLGGTEVGQGTLFINSMTARLVDNREAGVGGYGTLPYGQGPYGGTRAPSLIDVETNPWVGGMGHAGVRFVGKPTTMLNTGIRGGTAGYAATFREVGSWLTN